MHKIKGCWTILILLAVTGNVLSQTVKVNWQVHAPFSDYHTYAWRTSKNEGAHFYKQWVQKDVDAVLAKKGFRRVSVNQKPDLYIYYHIVTQEVMDSTTMDDGFGWGGGPWGTWGGWGGWGMWGGLGPDIAQTTVQPRMMGILAVDLIDANRKTLVWRGQATTDAISNTQKGDANQVRKAIDKMFKQFPPPKTK